MNKREKQKEETVTNIIRVSEELFHKQGYEKTTIQNIAERCGLSKGALYHHFRSKEEVLERICYLQYAFMKKKFLPIIGNSELSMIEKIRQIMTIARGSQMNTASASFTRNESSKSNIIQNAAMNNLFNDYSEKVYMEIFASLLNEGKDKGECTFNCSGEIMAIFIHRLDNGMTDQLNRILFDKDNTSPEKQIIDVIKGFTFALAQLLKIDEKVIAEVTLEDKMLEQYQQILKNLN